MAVRLTGFEPSAAFEHSRKLSNEAFVAEEAGVPIAAWGYAAHGLVGVSAYGWFLSSPRVAAHPIAGFRQARAFVNYVLTLFPRFQVQVHKSHKVSQSWLAWLGFTPIGEDAEFYTLEKVR